MDMRDIFIDNLPKLDLHGYDRDSARFLINQFVNDNIKMKNEYILIIHGIGSGIIRKTTNETLKQNKNVIDFKSCYFNMGCTVAKIKF